MDSLLIVKRRPSSEQSTIGEMFWHGESARQCYVLEDPVRAPGVKIPKVTAIPADTYELVKRFSTRFNQQMPYLVGGAVCFGSIVPTRDPFWKDAMFHPGNDAADTDACPLVGRTLMNGHYIGESRLAFKELMARLDPAWRLGRVYAKFVDPLVLP